MAVGDALAFFALDAEVAGRRPISTVSRSVMPRLASASTTRGSALAILSLASNSSGECAPEHPTCPRQQLVPTRSTRPRKVRLPPAHNSRRRHAGRDGAAVVEAEALGAAGFIQRDGLEERIGVQTSLRPDAGGGGGDFFGEERSSGWAGIVSRHAAGSELTGRHAPSNRPGGQGTSWRRHAVRAWWLGSGFPRGV